jgi:hypothetical protein
MGFISAPVKYVSNISIGYVIPDIALSILGYSAVKGADAAADTAKGRKRIG